MKRGSEVRGRKDKGSRSAIVARPDGCELFADLLRSAGSDIRGLYDVLSSGLHMDFTAQMDLPYEATENEIKKAADQHPAAILGVGKFVTFMADHNTQLKPRTIGIWLGMPSERLWYQDELQAPIDVLWPAFDSVHSATNNDGLVSEVNRVVDAACNYELLPLHDQGVVNGLYAVLFD